MYSPGSNPYVNWVFMQWWFNNTPAMCVHYVDTGWNLGWRQPVRIGELKKWVK
jgi:hypothetical protein